VASRAPRSERGSALVELTWLAILLLVPLVYIVLAVFEVQRAAFAASAAARSAGRAFVMAPSPMEGQARAREASTILFADQGLAGSDPALVLGCRPAGGCLTPGSVVQVRVSYQVPLPFLPVALGDQAPSIRVSSEHTVPYGTFREDRS
jgi:Flp pilus assembly protein TadG